MKTIANTKKGSEHWRGLNCLKIMKDWNTPKDIIRGLNLSMCDGTLGRRLREDRARGILKSRNDNGYTEYKWKSGRLN
jgi:hypothetical protein